MEKERQKNKPAPRCSKQSQQKSDKECIIFMNMSKRSRTSLALAGNDWYEAERQMLNIPEPL